MLMGYSALDDDRPTVCEGCNVPDYPSQFGPSAKQITWNDVLKLWLCCDCRYQWSNWAGSSWETEAISNAKKPSFLIMKERERATQGGC
jgi:hypothetical protein